MRLLPDSPETRASYDRAFQRSSTASVYQSLEWMRLFALLSYELAFLALEGDNFVPFLVKGRGPLKRAISLPFDTYGGPVAKPDDPIPLDRLGRASGIASVRIVDFGGHVAARSGRTESRFTYMVDLTRGYEHVHGSYSSQNRKALRQSKRRGVSVKPLSDLSQLPAFYGLYAQTKYKRTDIGSEFLKEIFETMVPKNLARFYLAWHEDRPVAGMIVLRAKNTASWWTMANDDRFLHLRPNNALIDGAIHDEISSGTELFNLGTTPFEKEGVLRFKEGFGAWKYPYKIVMRARFFYHLALRMRYGRRSI